MRGLDSRILDIGCGTGAQTLVLAQHTDADITAIDLQMPFLEALDERATRLGVAERVHSAKMSMDTIAFPPQSFDLIWAEGCIYHIGFERGLTLWKPLLTPDGHMAVSELCWLTGGRPQEIEEYWTAAYGGIDTVEGKLSAIRACGYDCLAHFVLPEGAWKNYYDPIVERTPAFAARHRDNPEVADFLQEGLREAALYDRYKAYYSYVFFVLKG